MKRKFMVQRNFCDWDKLVFLWRENFEKHLDWWFSAAKSSEIEWLIRKHWDRNFKHQTIAKWRKTVFSFRYISICRHLNCVCRLTCFATLSLSLSPQVSLTLPVPSMCMCVYVCVDEHFSLGFGVLNVDGSFGSKFSIHSIRMAVEKFLWNNNTRKISRLAKATVKVLR